MQDFVASGRVVDLILAVMVAEAVALGAWRAYSGRGIGLADLLVSLSAGVALLLALRFALTGAGWQAIAAALAAGGALHAADLARRWPRRAR
jgi:hypothetical protein